MATETVLSNYRVGSGDWGWDIEFAMLTGQDAHRELTAKMQADIACNGMIEAVLLGTDMRVWNGYQSSSLGQRFRPTGSPCAPIARVLSSPEEPGPSSI